MELRTWHMNREKARKFMVRLFKSIELDEGEDHFEN